MSFVHVLAIIPFVSLYYAIRTFYYTIFTYILCHSYLLFHHLSVLAITLFLSIYYVIRTGCFTICKYIFCQSYLILHHIVTGSCNQVRIFTFCVYLQKNPIVNNRIIPFVNLYYAIRTCYYTIFTYILCHSYLLFHHLSVLAITLFLSIYYVIRTGCFTICKYIFCQSYLILHHIVTGSCNQVRIFTFCVYLQKNPIVNNRNVM